MPRIFICYRRDDSAGHAGRLFDRVQQKFGRGEVFMDVAGIEGGTDFQEAIDRAVGSCDVLVAVIGQEWLTGTDAQGRRRLDDPQDFVRLEIGTALARGIRVIPVLVQGARIPAADLPEDLKPLSRRQAVELRDTRWPDDVQELIDVLARAGAPKRRPRFVWAGAGALAAGLVLAAIVLSRWPDRDSSVARWSEGVAQAGAGGPVQAGVGCRDGEVLASGGCECLSGKLHSSYPSGGAEGTPAREWRCEGQCASLRAVALCYPAADP